MIARVTGSDESLHCHLRSLACALAPAFLGPGLYRTLTIHLANNSRLMHNGTPLGMRLAWTVAEVNPQSMFLVSSPATVKLTPCPSKKAMCPSLET